MGKKYNCELLDKEVIAVVACESKAVHRYANRMINTHANGVARNYATGNTIFSTNGGDYPSEEQSSDAEKWLRFLSSILERDGKATHFKLMPL